MITTVMNTKVVIVIMITGTNDIVSSTNSNEPNGAIVNNNNYKVNDEDGNCKTLIFFAQASKLCRVGLG